jgi:hypothetical protein
MRQLAAAIILTGVFCAAVPAQSDSGLVFGIEWHRVINSPIGASLVEQIEKSPLAQIPEFKTFQDVLLNDVDSVTISVPSTGLNPGVEQPPALMIVKGRFETAHLRSLLVKKGQVVEKYNAVELLSPPNSAPKSKPDMTRVALLDSHTIIAGDRAEVRAAIDRIKKGGTGQIRPVSELTATNDLWMIVNIPPDAAKEAPAGMAQMFSGLTTAELGMSFGDGIALEINLRTKDDATAQTLAQGMQGLLALAALNQSESSKTSIETLKKIQITPEGPLVKVELALDKSEFERVMLERQAPHSPAAAPAPPAPTVATRTEPVRPEPAGPKMIRISGLDSGTLEIPLAKSIK